MDPDSVAESSNRRITMQRLIGRPGNETTNSYSHAAGTWKPFPPSAILHGRRAADRNYEGSARQKVLVIGRPCRVPGGASSRSLLFPNCDDAALFQGSAQRRLLICRMFPARHAPDASKGVRLAPFPFHFTSRAQNPGCYAVVLDHSITTLYWPLEGVSGGVFAEGGCVAEACIYSIHICYTRGNLPPVSLFFVSSCESPAIWSCVVCACESDN